MNLAIWLERAAVRYPDRPALYRGSTLVADYRSFHRDVCRVAGGLKERYGLSTGDRVGLFMANSPEYLVYFYAIWQAGCVAVPINYKLHAKEAAYILDNSESACVIADASRAAVLSDVIVGMEQPPHLVVSDGDAAAELLSSDPLDKPAPRERDHVAWLFYTSGTTGRPKGVMMTHGVIQAMSHAYFVDVDEVYPDDVALYAAPLSHGAGIYNFMHILRGAAHSVPESGGFDPAEILDLARKLKSVHMFGAPTMVKRLVEYAKATGETGEGIRTIVYGGGPMYVADIIDAVEVMGPRFVQIYGQGECPMAITSLRRELVADRSHPRWRERLGSVGSAQSCVDVAIVDEDGVPLPVGETGEIVAKGSPVMLGYWRNPEASAKTLRDGWLFTGDVGRMDEEGYITLTDRSKDVIISGGTNIYPREVEEVLLQRDDIAEVSVIGRKHPEWGEDVVACVVCRPGPAPTAAELDAHCLDNMARFKRPKDYVFLDALPKNTYGKVLKTELREKYGQEPGG